ncbi:PE-PGRS family protein [Chondromyces crocatus]|nr:PE-PGRS family protein [Chondromyces crocatus]
MVSLNDCTLEASNGGKGGAGGAWQEGGAGGAGGPGGNPSGNAKRGCSGGAGGFGGAGGQGGGGRGGHALAIAYSGATVSTSQEVRLTQGEAGLGGEGSSQQNAGAPGIKAPQQEFP